ncbi:MULTISPECIES: amidohydrolase [unclassified Meiothermus]|uniref:amidohydrolase family protein n=1 Tax=unclassified Meiothermus TaxID=370471 RepID=UPI000D7BB2F5|nr:MULTISPECIES: amidohydrolase family protein [unclassified Meiothermus]PZA06085.1 amidohydrolase [Meiothermus sp. Pnk-1]RYM31416.1 amidohydrolase [Meiothermus sp. PNK-Is4]
MVIDAHQHFIYPSRIHYPWLEEEALSPIRRDFTPEDLQPLLRESGVERTILVQTRSSLEETHFFLEIAAQSGFVAGVVGWVNLTDPSVGEVLDEVLASPHGRYLVGLRHQVHDEEDPCWLLQDAVQQGLEELGRRGLVYDFLTRTRELPACLETARGHPEVRFVVDHLAKPNIREGQWAEWVERLAPLSELPNVWVKLSGLVTEADWQRWRPQDLRPYVQEALRLFGPERCLFGSDWPVCLLAGSYAEVKGALEAILEQSGLERASAEWKGIFGTNAATVYRVTS